MRKKNYVPTLEYKIMVLDDEIGVVESLAVVLRKAGYDFSGFTDPSQALEVLGNEHYDILVLDFLMESVHGDEVVRRIRKFDSDLYILLLTGHKDLAPPLETIRALDIQGYSEKSDRFDQLILLIESAVKAIIQRKTISMFKDGLKKILESLPGIYQLQPIGNILEDILKEVMPFANSKNGFILIDDIRCMNYDKANNSIFRGIGAYNTNVDEFMLGLSLEFIESIGYCRLNKKVNRLKNGVIVPLVNIYNDTMGVIYIESENYDEGVELLEIFSNQASAALNNALLHSLVNTKNEELVKTYDELRLRYLDTIELLRLAVDAKDEYTRGHSERVAYYAMEIGKAFGLGEEELELLKISGIFHDVGKIGTADDILLKTGKLDKKEYEEIRKHPLKGAHILSAVSMFRNVVPLVKYHHERIDGKGYPEGLKGDEIPFLARILTAADAFDAMTSDRHYRNKLELEDAKKQLLEGAGAQFDAGVVNVLINLIEDNFDKMQSDIAKTYEMIEIRGF